MKPCHKSTRSACPIAALFLIFVLLAGTLTQEARAGAWTQPAGHGQILWSTTWFQSRAGYGPNGAVSAYGQQGLFRQVVVAPYMELGITQRTTLVFSPSIPYLEYHDGHSDPKSGGLGDFELAVRRRLNSPESKWVWSGQFTTMFAPYSSNRNPAPGNHQQDVEGRVLTGRGGAIFGKHAFWDAEGAYRFRTGAPADQIRGDVTAGMDVTRRLMLMGQLFSIKGMRNGAPIRPNSNPNAQSDFDLYKFQASAVVTVVHGMRVQAGWGRTFGGRNTGRGATVVLGVWTSF